MMLFPANQYKDTVTVLTPYKDLDTGDMRYFRRVLDRCFWNADSVEINRTGGTVAPEQVTLNVPLLYNDGYVNRVVWADMPRDEVGGYYTIRTGGELEHSIILRGDVEYPQLEEWAGSEAIGRVLRDFRRVFGGLEHSPTNVSEYLFGPQSMHRIVCVC